MYVAADLVAELPELARPRLDQLFENEFLLGWVQTAASLQGKFQSEDDVSYYLSEKDHVIRGLA